MGCPFGQLEEEGIAELPATLSVAILPPGSIPFVVAPSLAAKIGIRERPIGND